MPRPLLVAPALTAALVLAAALPPTGPAVAAAAPTLSVAVSCAGPCVSPSGFVAEFGQFAVSGTTTGMPADSVVYVYRDGTRVGSTTVGADGRYAWAAPVGAAGTARFSTSTAAEPGLPGAASSPAVAVTVRPAAVTLTTPTTVRSYALEPATISGRVVPELAGQPLAVQVLVGSTWRTTAAPVTTTGGAFSASAGHDLGFLGVQRWRVALTTPNAQRLVASPSVAVEKVAELRLTSRPAAAADVPVTYRPGCPVPVSGLTRLDLNFHGFDGRLHRGFLVVRDGAAARFAAVFSRAFATRFPMREMRDPSPYGNDYVSMERDNTYAFFCRTVTGNPYALSPHSYGGSVDVNTVENPYRQPDGRWVPPNGAPYVDRSVARPGMLFRSTPMTQEFLVQGFEWLSPFDYQHFQL